MSPFAARRRNLSIVISGREPPGPAFGGPDDRLRERTRNDERKIIIPALRSCLIFPAASLIEGVF